MYMLARGTLILSLALVMSCGGTSEPPVGTSSARLCDQETRAVVYVSGMEVASGTGMFKARLLESQVGGVIGVPDVGLNTWSLELADDAGAPMVADEVKLRPWMPDHGHGTSPAVFLGTAEAGRYDFGPFDVHMPGFWEFELTVTSGTEVDSTVIGFCVEG